MLDNYSMSRNSYQMPPTGNVSSPVDIEFMDPAILAVGKGRIHQGVFNNNPVLDTRLNFPSQLNNFENEARLQLLMQRSPPGMMQRISDYGNSLSSSHNDSYGIALRLMDHQSQANNHNHSSFNNTHHSVQQSRNPPMSNGHWDGWNNNEPQSGNSLGVAELLRNERLGYNKFYSGYEDTKFRMPTSGDLYNRTFGM
jgi:CCR4-NOT transcription complex subunit 4